MIPASNINIKPVVYLKDTDGNYVFDTNNQKIIEKIQNEVNPFDDYEYLITITEFFGNTEYTPDIKEKIKNIIEISEVPKINL